MMVDAVDGESYVSSPVSWDLINNFAKCSVCFIIAVDGGNEFIKERTKDSAWSATRVNTITAPRIDLNSKHDFKVKQDIYKQ